MGVVYLADDTRLSRRVALKSLSLGLDVAVGGRERLTNEARMAAALTHPGIATNATGATTAIGTTESSGTSIPRPAFRMPAS